MPLLNYTTTVEAAKTASEIVALLAAHGAAQIMMDWQDGEIMGVAFMVHSNKGDLPFRLPARPEAVFEALKRDNRKGKVAPRYVNAAQARRVAWRIVKDWVEVQMALIETGMAPLEEVFLPYLMVSPKQTLFELMEQRQFALPPGNSGA